ncbi:MAG TPA: cyanophycinase [Bacteroidales bacterium]|nr:cyanophycinase [Bacteroidales bacterium]HPS18263.1 cyanophycinase [Bacteroidales bacterium]
MHFIEYPNNTSSPQKGHIVLIGGAEDKKNDKQILKRVIGINNAKTAVIIPTASNYPAGLAEDYFYAFRDLGVENNFIFDIRERSETDKPEYLEKIEQADLIFFTGGDQFKLVSTLIDTQLFQKIVSKNLRGATIAGTSAGAAAACDPILFDGDYNGLQKGTIRHFKGFGFIKNITIDTHFVSRGRLGRLTQFLTSGQSTKGIGIGENTSIIISPDNTFEVVGAEMVTVVNTENVSYSNFDEIKENDPIVINDIRIGFLQSGSFFDLNDWKVLPTNNFSNNKPEKVRLYS